MSARTLRPLADTPDDVALGRALVREYVVATAEETGADVDWILSLVPDVDDFAGRYLRGGGYVVCEVDDTRADAAEPRTAQRGSHVEVTGGVGITPRKNGECEMNRLWIRPAFRSAGLGRVLAEASLAHARDLGFTRMVLDVVPSRTGAIALYRSLGFTDIEPFHDYGFEMVAFAKEL